RTPARGVGGRLCALSPRRMSPIRSPDGPKKKEKDMTTQIADESDVNLMDMESIADKRLGPGILMLSTSMQLIYSDRRAWELCGGIHKSAGKATNGVLPPAVAEMCDEIIKHLHVRTDVKDWEQFRIKRVLGD